METLNNKIDLKKHSALIQMKTGPLTGTQRKIINLFIFIIQRIELENQQNEKPLNEIYQIPLSIIKKICGVSATNNQQLKSVLRGITDVKMEFNYLQKDKNHWGIGVLFSYIGLKDGLVEFEMPAKIKKRIINPSMFTPINIHLLTDIKHNGTIALYEFLRDYLGSERPSIEFKIGVDTLRHLLGLDGLYVAFRKLKEKVLTPSINEINNKLDIDCEMIAKKNGPKPIENIIFKVCNKQNNRMSFSKQLQLFEKDELEIIKEYVQIMNEQGKIKSNISGYENTIKLSVQKDKSLLTGLDLTIQKHKADLKIIEEKQARKKKIEQDLDVDKPVGPVMSKEKFGELIKSLKT